MPAWALCSTWPVASWPGVVLAGYGSPASTTAAAVLAAQVGAGACRAGVSTLAVTGTGTASAKPDVLTVVVDVSVTGATASGALSDDNAKSASVISTLTRGGVAVRDVQTSNDTLQPRYGEGNPPPVVGYQVTNTITAKLRRFSTAGALVDAVVGAAGDAARLDSLTFSLSDQRQLQDRARGAAVDQARSHAGAMAAAAGEHLGPICSVSDQSQPAFPQPLQAFASSAATAAPPVALAAGTQQASAQVKMVYSLTTAAVANPR